MKAWISIAIVAAFALIAGLGTVVYRGLSADAGGGVSLQGPLAERGLKVASEQGCVACHTLDGSPGIGPTWKGMFGRTETLQDGSRVVVDAAYIRESILNPASKLVQGFQNVMIGYPLSEEDLEALVEFTRQLSDNP